MTQRRPPPTVRGKQTRFFYATQVQIEPPTFVLFANEASNVHFSYRRYLENRLRETFGFAGTPLRLIIRERAREERERPQRERSEANRQARFEGTPMTNHATRAVIGAGAWGTTLALHLAKRGPVVLLARDETQARQLIAERRNARYVPDVTIPVEVEISADPQILHGASELVVFAVPAAAMRATARRVAGSLHDDAVLMSVAKGLEQGTLERMTQVLADEIPGAGPRIAAMSGPNLALEIAGGLPASSVIAAEDEEVSRRASDMLGTRSFRLYRTAT